MDLGTALTSHGPISFGSLVDSLCPPASTVDSLFASLAALLQVFGALMSIPFKGKKNLRTRFLWHVGSFGT